MTGRHEPVTGGHEGDPPGLRPVWAEVDLSAIRDNVGVLLGHAQAPELMAIVKADGYGHGSVEVARAAIAGGATWLGVALVEEGVVLRRAGITAPILVLAEPPPVAAGDLLAAGLTPTVYSRPFVDALAEAVDGGVGIEAAVGSPVDVHLKLDTGMRRVGLVESLWEDGMRHLASLRQVRVTGIWSHLAVGDEPDNPFTHQQHDAFLRGLDLARSVGLDPDLVHLCNSGGTTLYPDLHHDIVRTGIAMYGLDAAPGVRLAGLRPAMALRARLSMVKPLAAGETVSYGRRWTAPEDTTVGTVPAGYADGVRRGLTNVGAVTHDGGRRPIIGTVCMDQFLIDLGRGSSAASDDDVWLIGGPGADPVTAEDWAAWLHTITYEVTCGIGSRVPRVYRNT